MVGCSIPAYCGGKLMPLMANITIQTENKQLERTNSLTHNKKKGDVIRYGLDSNFQSFLVKQVLYCMMCLHCRHVFSKLSSPHYHDSQNK